MIKTTRSKLVKPRWFWKRPGRTSELQRSGTTLICREESNSERIEREIIREYKVTAFSIRIRIVVWTGENDTKTISADGNRFENGAKQHHFHLKTV